MHTRRGDEAEAPIAAVGAQVTGRMGAAWRRWSVIGVAVLAMLAAACSDDDSTGPDGSTQERRAFIDGIVPHHQMASMMADEAIA